MPSVCRLLRVAVLDWRLGVRMRMCMCVGMRVDLLGSAVYALDGFLDASITSP